MSRKIQVVLPDPQADQLAELDDAGTDPREELAFQTQLNDYAHTLQRESTAVTKTWTPGAPPDQWASE